MSAIEEIDDPIKRLNRRINLTLDSCEPLMQDHRAEQNGISTEAIPVEEAAETATPDPAPVETAKKKKKSVHLSIEPPDEILNSNRSLNPENEAGEAPADDDRGNWGGKMEFLFTCIGYAVGLGNVWRFPYLCYKNGGGAFLLPYVIMLGVVGLPLFFMELAFGQFASLGPITIWKINPLFKGLGYAMVAVDWLISLYYNVIISHVLLYLFMSLASIPTQLPWVTCDNWWNTEFCLMPKDNKNVTSANETMLNTTVIPPLAARAVEGAANATGLTRHLNNTNTPAEEYYKYFVLEQSESIDDFGGINWKLALCLLLSWMIVLACLIRGIQSLGKVVYFTAVFPYIMLTILLVRGASLPGALEGVKFYLIPDFDRLADPRVWSDAATQIFYSLSACTGGLIAMASYNKFNNNCYKDAITVALINCATSIYAGFVIFCVLGFMAYEKGVSVADVAQDGPGLAFVVYPEAISRMPAPQLWAIFFFIMMASLGFGSQFSIVECVMSAFTDEFPNYLRGKWESICFRSIVVLTSFLLGLPMVAKGGIYLLTLVDYSVGGFPLLFIGFFEIMAISWIYKYERFAGDIQLMLGSKPNIYWKICWVGLTPTIIVITIVFNCIFYKEPYLDNYLFPEWAKSLGWLIAVFPMVLIPLWFMWRFCRDGGFEVMREAMRPKEDWGPADPSNRKAIYATEVQLTPSHFDIDKHFSFPHIGADTERRLFHAPLHSSFPNILLSGPHGSITKVNRDHSVSTHSVQHLPEPQRPVYRTASHEPDTHV